MRRKRQRDLNANEPFSIWVLKGQLRGGGKKHLSTDPSVERESGRERERESKRWVARCELSISDQGVLLQRWLLGEKKMILLDEEHGG